LRRTALAVALCLLCWLLLPGWQQLVASANSGYYMLLGARLVHFDHPPVVQSQSKEYLSIALLDQLAQKPAAQPVAAPGTGKPMGGRSDGQDEEPPERARVIGFNDIPGEGDKAALNLLPAPGALTPPKAGMTRYKLAGHALDLAQPGQPLAGELDNHALPVGALFEYNGHRYILADTLRQVGLLLCYDGTEELYQLAGLIYNLDFTPVKTGGKPASFTINCLTPLLVDGTQGDDGTITLVAHGGFMADTTSREYSGNPVLAKVGLKSQPELGRAFLFLKQPTRTGFKIVCDPLVGFVRISFGNYFQVVSYNKSSSGEISLNVQLGAACKVHDEFVDSPPRLVIDFPGAVFDDASQTLKVNQGRVTNIRVGSPEAGTVRVVIDLKERVDYRILANDGGARYYIQLLPPSLRTAPAEQQRLGRTIMIDAGHGGSDPGAPGVIPGVDESVLNLQIANDLADELRKLGYDTLMTRKSERFVSLGTRTDYANDVLPYLFVSVHCNSIESADFQGVMTFHHPTSVSSTRLAELVHAEVLKTTGAVDKGVRTAKFFVLRETVMPSVLVECGFLTNPDECRKLIDPQYQRLIAQGIARGVDRYVTSGF
jgi:N-acetylmuramoyl-L-alanine amidase